MAVFSDISQNGKKATRPCRCGHLDDPALACTRAPRCARDYQAKISGPLYDPIDLQVARTLADLETSDTVHRIHVAEAFSYRRLAPGLG